MDEKKQNNMKVTEQQETMALDDARRVKVMSPSMLVFKRFIRNKLAITGMVILVFMFVFSFIGALFSPYTQSEVFKQIEYVQKDYATGIINNELRYVSVNGEPVSSTLKSQIVLAVNKGNESFLFDGNQYTLLEEGDQFYTVSQSKTIASVLVQGADRMIFTPGKGYEVSKPVEESFRAAYKEGLSSFEAEGKHYSIHKNGKLLSIGMLEPSSMASRLIFDATDHANEALVGSYAFRYAAEKAINEDQTTFEYDGAAFTLLEEEQNTLIYDVNGNEFATISNTIIETSIRGLTLGSAFRKAARDAIKNKQDAFVAPDETGAEVEFKISRVNANYYIKTNRASEMIRINERPSAEHWLGLDGNGMDIMTRLMYGGRISLMVGFVVVLIELFIGIVIGGISGYFGGWIDTALMRVVDLFNSIPFWPVAIITGSVMDSLEVAPMVRIFLLMFVLGVLGWTGIARVVRGQILSLREQDFMVATEATGISVSRRIFKHLVPNVMPLLIVQATMALGSIIITEATLSFLGLGVKYPLASWGSIINASNDIHIMTNYWFIWLPAGLLILMSVLGFNFVGDGLRDAFDPKMKR